MRKERPPARPDTRGAVAVRVRRAAGSAGTTRSPSSFSPVKEKSAPSAGSGSPKPSAVVVKETFPRAGMLSAKSMSMDSPSRIDIRFAGSSARPSREISRRASLEVGTDGVVKVRVAPTFCSSSGVTELRLFACRVAPLKVPCLSICPS